MEEELKRWWKRSSMEEEQMGGGRGVQWKRNRRGVENRWMEEEQMGGGRGVGWKRKPMMSDVVEEKEGGAEQRKMFPMSQHTGSGGDADDNLSKQIGRERQTDRDTGR